MIYVLACHASVNFKQRRKVFISYISLNNLHSFERGRAGTQEGCAYFSGMTFIVPYICPVTDL